MKAFPGEPARRRKCVKKTTRRERDVRPAEDTTDPVEREHMVLTRMMADADRLCQTDDPFMLGQYRHLRGRVAALVEMTRPTRTVQR
jgi:hypothetical protein